MGARGILRTIDGGRVGFRCPGCDRMHAVAVDPGNPAQNGANWGFNGDYDRPSFTPSVLVTYSGSDAGIDRGDGGKAPPAICHSFVTDGQIQFLGDCTHALAGQTVPLPSFGEVSNG